MNLSKAVAAAPIAKRVWRLIPGPLRIPVVLVGGYLAIKRLREGDDGGGTAA